MGLVWATWHLRPLLTPGAPAESTLLEQPHAHIRFVSASAVHGRLFHAARGPPPVIVAHTARNTAVAALPAPA